MEELKPSHLSKTKDVRSFSIDNYAKAKVSEYKPDIRELKCQTYSDELILENDGMYDHNRQFLNVGTVTPLDELETTKRLFVEDIRNFEVGDAVEIYNGSLDDEYIENEIVKIEQIYSSGSMVVIRGFEEKPLEIPDGTEIKNTSRYVYTIITREEVFMSIGDTIHVQGSQYEEVNGEHQIIAVDDKSFRFFVSQEYEPESTITYTTTSPIEMGKVAQIKVTSPGYGYESLPKIEGVVKKPIDRALTKIKLEGGQIQSVDILFGGSRYTNPVAIFVDATNNGYGAEARVEVRDGKVIDIVVTYPGTNYIEPALYLVEMDGKYLPLTEDIGAIKSIKVINPGRNISADLSLRPELQITTRLVLQMEEGEFSAGDQVFQGTKSNMMCTANVIGIDYQRNILMVNDIFGIIKEGEYIHNVDGGRGMVLVSGQADCRVSVDDVAKPAGDFIDDKSKVSEAYAVIQDSYRYQWFSYVISSPLQQMEYDTFVKEIIHPAGFIQFGDVSIHDSTQSGSIILDETAFYNDGNSMAPLLISGDLEIPLLLGDSTTTEFWINTQ